MVNLLDYRRDYYSQTGEDGILEKLLWMLPQNKWCIECGAWDGEHLSNTRNLVLKHGYHAILIEKDVKRFRQLQEKCGMVGTVFGDVCRDLDKILEEQKSPLDPDFMSIDIDGLDYYVWSLLLDHRPKVVCIEFNPTMAPGFQYIQRYNPALQLGSSLDSITRLAGKKGYYLGCVLPWNAIFVDQKYPLDLGPITRDLSQVAWTWFGYDGSRHFDGVQVSPWKPGSL